MRHQWAPDVASLDEAMDSIVVLTRDEEEYLVRTFEESIGVRRLQQFFLWTQGQFQGVLPHGIMVCVKFAENGEVERVECLRRMLCDLRVLNRLCDASDGLVVRIARYCRSRPMTPRIIAPVECDADHPMSVFHAELKEFRFANVVAHGTESISGGGTFFVLLSLPQPPTARQAFLLSLLLPALHLAFSRVASSRDEESEQQKGLLPEPLTPRELDVLRWVSKGKTNHEIGLILDLSSLTIKNHLQKVFRKLSVNNRMQASLRCRQLRLLDGEQV